MEKPKIRFKGYQEDWEQRKFSELCDMVTVGIANSATHAYSDSGIVMFRNQNIKPNFLDDNDIIHIKPEFESRYKNKRLKKNDLLVARTGYPGTACVVPEKYENSQTFTTLIARPKNSVNPYFLCQYLNSDIGVKYFESTQIGGGQKNSGAGILNEMPVMLPSGIEEESKIAEYFTNFDHLITLHQRKCEEMKTLKKYMLQKMFPQNGQLVPQIRFSGFTEDWEQRKFGDLADYKKGPFGSAITKDIFVPKSEESIKVYEQQNAINKDWELERYFLPKEYALTKLKSFEVQGGDIIVSCAGTIGEIYEIPENADTGVINQALMRVRVDEDCVDKRMFKIAFSNMIDDFTRVHSNGSAIKNIPPFSDLKPMGVLLPSLQEQKKISSYFEKLDNLITLHQQKCDELRNIKKFMLQNMFI